MRLFSTKTKPLVFIGAVLMVFYLVFHFATPQEREVIQRSFPVTPTQAKSPTLTPIVTIVASEILSATDSAIVYPVVKVVDGDTLTVLKDGKRETIRLIGINTPETVDPRKGVECFGREASNYAKGLLQNTSVRLQADPTQGERDKYNRLLRYVYMNDGRLFNEVMIQGGYAYEYTYNTPYMYQQQFKHAESLAREQKQGLWSDETCKGSL